MEDQQQLKPCPFCGETPSIVTRNVEPQGDPWYGRKDETFVLCNCGACLFDGSFHEGFYDAETRAVAAWNRRASPSSSVLERARAVQDVLAERQRQDEKWGGPGHDDHHTVAEWVQLIEDYAGWARVMAGMNSPDKARRRLIQVAALAVAAVETIDRSALAEIDRALGGGNAE